MRPGQLVVSLAAGITTAFIESRLPDGIAVVRVMPNTPGPGRRGHGRDLARAPTATTTHLAIAEALLGSTGRVLRVPEKQQDAVTAISGSGPAYLFFVVESMIEAGVHLGLPRATATELVVQTVVGSAKMLRETGDPPDRAARAGHLAGRHHRRRPPRAGDRTGCGRRSWPPWRPRATGRATSPASPERWRGRGSRSALRVWWGDGAFNSQGI